jgi:solute carrier family 24 (sodium/potassium/calcium exchanger), member 6
VKANCPDEEAGIFSYLSFYYCQLPHAKPVAFTIIAVWLALLFTTIGIAASDFFCINLATIANILGMSDSLTGVTFLAFGNGSPDIFSTFAAFKTNSGSLAIGELIGAASFITAVVAGSITFIRPFKAPRKTFVRDVGFFIIAASFSLVFLFDGKLHLWECCVLVGLYVFYVVFVLLWHWYFHRRSVRRRKEAAAREQFVVPGSEEAELGEEYHDDEDEVADRSHGRPSPLRGPSLEDLAALERGGEVEDEEEEEEREEVARAEITRNMRLSRPRARSRRQSHLPIRPSLVGALEFQAVLSDLQRSRNIHTMPIHLRRYSDDPRLQEDQLSSVSEPRADTTYGPEDATYSASAGTGGRGRAVSANGADTLGFSGTLAQGVPRIDLLAPLPEDDRSHGSASPPKGKLSPAPPSPTISLSPPPSTDGGSRATSPMPPRLRPISRNRLAPPDQFPPLQPSPQPQAQPLESTDQRKPPKLSIPKQPGGQQVRQVSPPASPSVPFPPYRDDASALSPRASRPSSIHLPQHDLSPESHFRTEFSFTAKSERPLTWWPYYVLPPPAELFCTLFPTVVNWREKNIIQKFVGIVTIPSIFLLKITLPVVETERDDDGEVDEDVPAMSLPGTMSSTDARTPSRTTPKLRIDDAESEHNAGPVYSMALGDPNPDAIVSTSSAAGHIHHHTHRSDYFLPHSSHGGVTQSPQQLSTVAKPSEDDPKDWNRWLVIVQLFTAPFFVVLIVWANTEIDNPRALFRPSLIALLISLIMLFILLATTTADRAPKWRVMLCFLGFAVSISWISTIANEVVGVLKTLGVILNISDAILGLTIFAVGNSCGDLVANVTVAKLGFPNMALSACWGGPMLNILLGIGLSGMYLTITGAQARVDKGKKLKFKPYHIEVSKTLLISGGTLLVTLVVLLVAVPLRRWKMDRFIGVALVAFWTLSTVANVIVEVMGLSTLSSS